MKIFKTLKLGFIVLSVALIFSLYAFAQNNSVNNEGADSQSSPPVIQEAAPAVSAQEPKPEAPEASTAVQEAKPEVEEVIQEVDQGPSLSAAENVTLDFKEADIQNVLKIISHKSGINIVTTPDVIGNVTIRLVDVPWQTALDVILKTYGYGSQRQGNIILVTKMENVSKIQAEEPLQTEIFNLKFLDAQDAEKILIPMLSPRGKISVLYSRGQKGWQFGTFKIGKDVTMAQPEREKAELPKSETYSIEKTPSGDTIARKAEFEGSVKSKVLVITDTAASLDKIRNVILPVIDKKPKQVIIESRIMEVDRTKLKDLGLDWGTGTSGASGYTTPPSDIPLGRNSIAGRNLMSEFAPSIFTPAETASNLAGTYPYSAGLELIYKKLSGTKLEVILHALEEDVNTNTLSAPKILTLDNQEASILVGVHQPILSTQLSAASSTGSGASIATTLDYYQEIGIRLNVVPQISEEGYINMIIHPSVTSTSRSVTATSTIEGAGSSSTTYPVIDVREAQTQLLIKDGDTIVIGGLLKDVKSKQTIGIPFLSNIPLLGKLFTRETTYLTKIDMLIFITARIVKEGQLSPEETERLQRGVDEAIQKRPIATTTRIIKSEKPVAIIEPKKMLEPPKEAVR